MSDPEQSDPQANAPLESQGVLANLPHTRPQRATARRTAARKAMNERGAARKPKRTGPASSGAASTRTGAASTGTGAASTRAGASRSKRRTRSTNGRRSDGARATEAIPRQGFECERESASGPVQPPGGAEFLASAMELAGELAKGGLSRGERLLKDVVSRLPLS